MTQQQQQPAQQQGRVELDLDANEAYERLDAAGMGRAIAELPAQSRQAWEAAQAWELPASLRTPKRVVALGMGGSAIGADIVGTLTAHWRAVPVQVVRGYTAPAIDEDTLVVANSFSGGTEETLEAFEGTLGGPGMRLAIT